MAPAEALLQVHVAYCPEPGLSDIVELQLPTGAVLLDALHASGLLTRHGLMLDGRVLDGLQAGIWSRVRDFNTPLRARDRVEIYRPLQVDPKEARRQRYKRDRPNRPSKANPPLGKPKPG